MVLEVNNYNESDHSYGQYQDNIPPLHIEINSICSKRLLCVSFCYIHVRNLHYDIFYELQFNHEIMTFYINTNVTIGTLFCKAYLSAVLGVSHL